MSSRPGASAASATGSFHRDPPRHWLTTAYSLMHAAAEDVAVSSVNADDAAGLITGTLLASFAPPAERHEPGMTRARASESTSHSA